MSDAQALLVLPRIRVQNANAISGPMTWGFPAMTAFVGLMHALERKIQAAGMDLYFNGVGVVCHHYEAQASQSGYVNALHLTRNPVNHKGETAAIVEEGRIHLDISLVFSVFGELCDAPDTEKESTAETVREMLGDMRVAGGTVLPDAPTTDAPGQRNQPSLVALSDDSNEAQRQFRKLTYKLLPGFTLVLRNDLLHQHWHERRQHDPETSLMDAWLDLSRLNIEATNSESAGNGEEAQNNTEWQVRRPSRPGWFVPIPVGFGALTEPLEEGQVNNCRDASVPFRFVESLFSIGQWMSPHRLRTPADMLWYPETDPETGLYQLQNDFAETQNTGSTPSQEL